MSLAGTAVVAIWNDVTSEGRANFYEWHNRQHMPERLAIDGFLRGRRYVATAGDGAGDGAGDPAYFTLYEVRDADVLAGPAYLARLNSPTPWTTASVAHFRNVARALCQIESSFGAASGGFLATWRFDADPIRDSAILEHLATALPTLAQEPGIVAAHAARADLAISAVTTAEQVGRPPNAVPRWVVLVEASTADAARAALASPLVTPGLEPLVLPGAARGAYALQYDLLG